jgi:hypothetical protein
MHHITKHIFNKIIIILKLNDRYWSFNKKLSISKMSSSELF